MKALGRADEPLAWRSIGVREDASGRVCLELTGAAAALAGRARVRRLELSLLARRSSAVAVVLAQLEEPT